MTLVSGVLQVLIFPSPNLYPLCWIALAPLMVAVLRAQPPDALHLPATLGEPLLPASPWQGFLLGYASGIVWYAGTCYWVYYTMHLYGGLNAPISAGILLLFCMYLALYHGAFGLLLAAIAGGAKNGIRRALALSPFLWVGLELARSRISGFPWDLLGTVQVGNTALNRITTITGVYGLSFEIVLLNTAFAAALLAPRARRKLIFMEAFSAAVLLQVLMLIKPPTLPTDHKAVLVQANVPILGGNSWTTDYFQGTVGDLTRISTSPPGGFQGAKPDLVVWPESPAPFYVDDPAFKAAIANVAGQDHAYVISGSMGTERNPPAGQPRNIYNSAALMDPQGDWSARYDKVHLVPFGEYVPFKSLLTFAGKLTQEVGDFGRGSSRFPLQAGTTALGVFICYESVFPDEVRQFAQNGAQVFVNISNDGWYGDTSAFGQHLIQARMRAVENNRWLLRDTNTGVTASIDPYGRIVTSLPRNVRASLQAPYSLRNGTTFYTRHGDWFAYGCAIIFVVALLMRFRIRAGTVQ